MAATNLRAEGRWLRLLSSPSGIFVLFLKVIEPMIHKTSLKEVFQAILIPSTLKPQPTLPNLVLNKTNSILLGSYFWEITMCPAIFLANTLYLPLVMSARGLYSKMRTPIQVCLVWLWTLLLQIIMSNLLRHVLKGTQSKANCKTAGPLQCTILPVASDTRLKGTGMSTLRSRSVVAPPEFHPFLIHQLWRPRINTAT